MNTHLYYFGRLRVACHCGLMSGRDVYLIDVGHGHALVYRSLGTADQATAIFVGARHFDSDLDAVLAIEWSDSEAAKRAREWIATECNDRAEKLMSVAAKMQVGQLDLALAEASR
jgi:hypothetical protein